MSNFNDFLGMQAAKLNMTREEYTAYYLSEAKPGPKPYHRGLDDDEIEDKKDQIKKQSDMDDDDSSAYKEMPGDKEAREKGEVKTSKHVKKYHELYGDKKDESVDEATFRPNSGTMSGGTYTLDNRKYKLKKDIEGVQIGNYTNIVLPKGTIIYNIPGGVFADHPSLKRYENGNNKYFNKPTFKGISIIRKEETIFSIDKNSKILESVVTEAKAYKLKASEFGGDTHSAPYNVKGEPTWRVHSTYAIDQVSGENDASERDVVFFEAMPINNDIYNKIGGINNLKRTNGSTYGNNFGTTIEEWKKDPKRIAKEASEFLTDATHLKWINKKARSQGQTIKWALKDDYSSVIVDLVNKSLGLTESQVNEFYFEKDEEERLQKFVDQLSFGDELEYRDGFSTGRGSFPNTRQLKNELDSNFQLLLTQKSGRNWDLYVGSDDLVFLIQPDLGAKNYMQVSISSTKEQWNDESSVFARSNGYSVYESVVNERAKHTSTDFSKPGNDGDIYFSKREGDAVGVRLGDKLQMIYVFQEEPKLGRIQKTDKRWENMGPASEELLIDLRGREEGKILFDFVSTLEESVVNEEKIKYAKGKTYQSSGHWTVQVDSNSSMCDIRVNHSAGWRLDPHDDREETWELLDNGRQRATIYFKSGNIDKFAKQMFDLNDRTTWGNKTKLTAKDYADIIRVWIDMKMANEGNYNLEDIYDLIAHHRFDKDYKKLSSKDREWIENDAEERGFVESLSPRFFNSLLVKLNEDLITESKVPNFKFGMKKQYDADDINQMYGFWGTLDVHMDTYEIEEIWNDVWGILTRGWKFSDAGALYYLNAKAGRWLADKVWNDINSQISQPDAIDMILSDYARPSKWKAWSKEYNTFAQEELAECVILEKAEGDRGPISDPKIEKALKTKSEETGVPIGIIRIIMRRGMAAWKTGHRPGATEQQWGYARVNAFLTKGKGTWGDADKDVAKEVRDEGHDDGLKEQNYFDQSHRKQNI